MLTTAPVQNITCDVECRLQAAARAFNANRWFLCDPKVSIAQKLECFDRIISPISCFAAAHRTIYRNDSRSMDVAYRPLLRSVVGPPHNMAWALPRRPRSWSAICLRHHWNLAQYFATLPGHRWIKRVLAWQPKGQRRSGRPKYCWGTLITIGSSSTIFSCAWNTLPNGAYRVDIDIDIIP